jgi:hypothetical protein
MLTADVVIAKHADGDVVTGGNDDGESGNGSPLEGGQRSQRA